ncbi:hypothetical protein RB2501_15634 [Robiginitalea biformata HTCC2501]|uniref:Uncharacterized protein n=1 Tax=Robiginitalea biformata (strain ATCC BAA-864 / DSM 15991 / KCTC 12146 / HTCC2501) TaxID=313596 RepID=A4CLM4_ROBBH|nr:hypothetical protein RB2501_15634 [Robiginitalea biformata HTCC2501]
MIFSFLKDTVFRGLSEKKHGF